MRYSRQFFRSHPFVSTRRKMDEIESKFLKPLAKQITEMETRLRRLTASFDKAFAENKHSGLATRLDYDRSKLVGKLARRKEKLAGHQARYNRLQRSLTSTPRSIGKKRLVAVRRAV